MFFFFLLSLIYYNYINDIYRAKIFYSVVAVLFFTFIFTYAYRKHREFEEYINKFEKEVQEKYYAQCQKHGYDPFALIEEMEEKMKEKEKQKKLEKKIEKEEEEEFKLLKLSKKEAQEYYSIKGSYEKKND